MACGTGTSAIPAVQAVRPGGSVLAVDNAERAGVAQVDLDVIYATAAKPG